MDPEPETGNSWDRRPATLRTWLDTFAAVPLTISRYRWKFVLMNDDVKALIPLWASDLLENMVGTFEVFGMVSHYISPDTDSEGTLYEIYMYPSYAVMEGVEELITPTHTVNLSEMFELFDETSNLTWTDGLREPPGFHFDAKLRDADFLVHILQYPPEGEEPAYRVDKLGGWSEL